MLLAVAILLALYLAFNLGANDVANAMGTSVGSKAVSLGQAIAIAGILEFSGAVLLGDKVSARLITDIIDPQQWQVMTQATNQLTNQFTGQLTSLSSTQQWLYAMLSVLLTAGLWLNLATAQGLPISASHTVVGAMVGVGLVAAGPSAIHWSTIILISSAWLVTPLVSGAIAAGVYGLVQWGILHRANPGQALAEWIPWLSVAVLTVFGAVVLPALIERSPLALLPVPRHDIGLGLGAMGALCLSIWTFRSLGLALESAPSSFVQSFSNPSLSELAPGKRQGTQALVGIEQVWGRFQVTSASFVAFAHGANDVGNAVAPMGAIVLILQTGQLPLEDFALPLWVLALGGVGIVAGLALLGDRVMQTIGEDLIELEPSSGFAAELATAATVLAASAGGLPVSTSHALVGAVVGVGWVKTGDIRRVRLDTVQRIALTWGVTLPVAAAIAALIFQLIQQFAP